MGEINFLGMVISYGIGVEPELAVCCASRIGPKEWRVVSLEGKFAETSPNFEILAGMLVSGKAIIQEIWDGSIMVQFMVDDFQILPDRMPTEVRMKLLKYVHAPRAERKITLAGKEFYRFRLDETYHPQQIKWNQRHSPLGKLSAASLKKDGDSLAHLTGYAMLFSKKRIKYGKRSVKVGIFLLSNTNCETHTPIFMLAEAETGAPWQKGGIYHFENLPILYNNDTLGASPAGEAESTLFCGKGKFALVNNPHDAILSFLYDELGDVANMPAWLWRKYFGSRLDRCLLTLWRRAIGVHLHKTDTLPKEKTHGWWYAWHHTTTLKINEPINEAIVILTPDFADGGPSRVIALPESAYKANRKRFPENAIAVSVSADPVIIEGAWKPESQSWELIKNWIRKNEVILKQEVISCGDFKEFDAHA